MTDIWLQAALWLGLALVASLISIWLRIATALSEIVVGAIAQLLIGAFIGGVTLGAGESWVRFLAGTGAIVLTFISAALSDFPEWRMLIYSIAMIVLMLYRPQGLFGDKELSLAMIKRFKKGGNKS